MTPKTKLLDFIKEYVGGGTGIRLFGARYTSATGFPHSLKTCLGTARLTRTGGGNQPSGHGARPAQDPGAVVPPGYPASSSLAQALALAASSRV